MPPVEIGRAILKTALARATAASEGARFVGAQLSGVAGTNVQTILEALKTLIDSKAASDDSRLSDARTPLAHAHAIGDLPVATSGTSSTTEVPRADDSRLSNARTPTAHGHSGADITSGTVAVARIGAGTKDTTTFYRGDGTFAAPPQGGVTQATESAIGGGELADTTESAGGTDHTRIMTPLRVAERIATRAPSTAPFTNIMPDSGRYAGKINPLSYVATTFANSPFFGPVNGSTVAEGGKFIYDNSTNGGLAGALNQDVQDLLAAMNRTSITARYGAEFFIANYTMGSTLGSSHISTVDSVTRYQMTSNGSRVLTGLGDKSTALFWMRLKTEGAAGNKVLVRNMGTSLLRLNNAGQTNDVLLGVTDGWAHISTQRVNASGVDNGIPYIYAKAGDVVQIAVPAFFAGDILPGVHKAPIATINDLNA